MVQMLPDRTFYPSAALAGEAPAETLAYVALLTAESNGKTKGHTDTIGVVLMNMTGFLRCCFRNAPGTSQTPLHFP